MKDESERKCIPRHVSMSCTSWYLIVGIYFSYLSYGQNISDINILSNALCWHVKAVSFCLSTYCTYVWGQLMSFLEEMRLREGEKERFCRDGNTDKENGISYSGDEIMGLIERDNMVLTALVLSPYI